jgi:gliding motility-associated-like protein
MNARMKQLQLLLLFALGATSVIAQPPVHRMNPVNEAATTHSFFTNRNEWSEMIESRDAHHAYWKHADGRMMIENCEKPIHFQKNNAWQRIDARFVETHEGWQALQQPHPIKIKNDASFILDYGQNKQATFGNNCSFNGQDLHLTCLAISEHDFTATSPEGSMIKHIRASENNVKYSYVLSEAPQSINVHSTFAESVEFSSPITVETFAHEGRWDGNLWVGPVHFFNERKDHVLTIMPLMCYDAAETWQQNSSRIAGGYSWVVNGAHVTITSHIPNTWLHADERSYPVTIDPLIIGPTVTFGDNVMLSCFIPDYNADSLLVTIPAQVTVTGCFVTASYWAEPLAGAIMMDGSMFFSTNCDSSGTFEVDPPTGLQAGTAYLELFDFRDPLLCCFAPSCSEQSFYLRMHLGRYTPEGDCNYAYIFYNPTTTLWPFTAFVEGRTVETYGLEFTVSGTPICSSQCTFEGKVRTKYGVPPYTISHPWMDGDSIVAISEPCDVTGSITDIYMQWPGCPEFCPEPFSLDVPPPTVVDACGNVVAGLVEETLNLKPAPSISDPSPVQVCSNIPEDIAVQSCAPDFTLTWSGNGTSGTGYTLPVLAENTDTVVNTIQYQVNTIWNGCPSDTLNLLVEVMPSPVAAFEIAPNPGMQGIPTFFVDQSTVSAGNITEWNWTLNGGQPQSGDINSYIIPDLGYHTVCLQVLTDAGCPDTLCKEFEVVTPSLDAPNIFTPNGDATNAVLVFDQLQFYPSSHLYVYNRWGTLVYEQENYQNNWDGGDLPEGVYYYVLNVEFYGSIASYVHIVR